MDRLIPILLVETGTQKDKLRHIKILKNLFEQKVIPMDQCQPRRGGEHSSPGAQGICTGEVLSKGRKLTGYGLVGCL